MPSLPGCISHGDDVDEAITHAREAIDGYIASMQDAGETIRDDSDMLEYTISIPVAPIGVTA